MMIRDVASAHRYLPQWENYQRGLEALAASLGSAHQHVDHSKKSLTIGDLLVKVNTQSPNLEKQWLTRTSLSKGYVDILSCLPNC